MVENSEAATGETEAARNKRWPWISLGLLIILALGVFVALARLQAQPIPAGMWLTERLEGEVDALLPEAGLSFRSIRLGMDENYHPQIYLDDVTITRSDGVPLADLRSVQGDLSIGALLQGEVELRRVAFSGVVILVERTRDGTFDFKLGEASGNGFEMRGMSSMDEAMTELDNVLERPGLRGLSEIRAEGISVNYADAMSGQTWIGDAGDLRIFRDGRDVLLTADAALLTGRGELTTISFTVDRDAEEGASLSLILEDAAAADIASQAPALAWLSVVDASVSGALRVDLSREGLGALDATLELGEGALRPNASTRPIPFSDAIITLQFDPKSQRLTFDEFKLDTAWGRASAQGSAQLQAFSGMVPREIIGQFQVSNVSANPGGLYDAPRSLEQITLDFRLSLNPFTFDIGQIVVVDDISTTSATGQVLAADYGWYVTLDASVDQIKTSRLLELWPVSLRPGLRRWFANNVKAGLFENGSWAVRLMPDAKPEISMSQHFSGAEVLIMRTLPPLTKARGSAEMHDGKFTIIIEEGVMRAPQGGELDAKGSVFHIGNTRERPSTAEVHLRMDGTITAALATLDLEPFQFLTKANRPVTLADGRLTTDGLISFPLKPGLRGRDVAFNVSGDLSGVRSEILIPERVLELPSGQFSINNDLITISGAGRLGRVPIQGAWVQPLGQGPVGSELRGTVEISPVALDEFNIALPPGSVTGTGSGALAVSLIPEQPPEFTLTSDLRGLTLSVPQVGWSKSAGSAGDFEAQGTLGDNPSVSRLALSAPGLSANGRVLLRPGGAGLDTLELDRVRVGDWLDAYVTLTGRGPGVPPAVLVSDAELDLRRADFGSGSGGGEGQPLTVALDRLQITEDIFLTEFRADLTTAGGLRGPFQGRVAGGATLSGNLEPAEHGTAVEVQSQDGGGVIRDAGIIRQVNGGNLALTLTPLPGRGNYDGRLDLANIRVEDAPSVAGLLSAVSVVGLIEQLDGNGLVFNEVDARFRLTPEQVIITESSAVGASLGISLDGIFNTAARQMDFQGVISPFYLVNGIGAIFTRRGEGLLGFNFTLRGSADDPDVGVNPFSVLTPGMFREIFRRPPPEVSQ
ncbi:MAG: DUF3971 domain-containing protein [Pseudomonadota bacterium]